MGYLLRAHFGSRNISLNTPGWRETKWSKVPCLRKQRVRQGLNPRPPVPECEVFTVQPHMPPQKFIIHCWASRWFLLFCSPKPWCKVWILIYRNCSVQVLKITHKSTEHSPKKGNRGSNIKKTEKIFWPRWYLTLPPPDQTFHCSAYEAWWEQVLCNKVVDRKE